jgi:hypothetical protein
VEILPRDNGAGRSDATSDATGDVYSDVGAFRQGSPLSQWALGRYLIGRALAVQVSRTLLALALLLFAIAIAVYVSFSPVLGVLVGLVAIAALGARALLRAILRRTTVPAMSGEAQRRLHALVADTRGDVGRELRRVGLPGRWWSMPLLAARLAGRRRGEVLARLRGFDAERVVPAARLDDLHVLLRDSNHY